jgi:hypothetical protein
MFNLEKVHKIRKKKQPSFNILGYIYNSWVALFLNPQEL